MFYFFGSARCICSIFWISPCTSWSMVLSHLPSVAYRRHGWYQEEYVVGYRFSAPIYPLRTAETSNRGTTRQRASIKRKASETRKKNAKHAKKDVTWKSSMSQSRGQWCSADTRLEKTKDIGIPNNFPYKEQVLAEMAEQKRLVRSMIPLETCADEMHRRTNTSKL